MDFARAVGIVIDEFEGGYVNDPRDPGGETKFGISKRSHPEADIANLTRAQAEEIYSRVYWTPVHCEELRPRLRLAVFDSAVQHGARAAIKLLQRAAGVSADGVWGPRTLAAVRAADERALLERFLEARSDFYFRLPPEMLRAFGEGWTNRLIKVAIRSMESMKQERETV